MRWNQGLEGRRGQGGGNHGWAVGAGWGGGGGKGGKGGKGGGLVGWAGAVALVLDSVWGVPSPLPLGLNGSVGGREVGGRDDVLVHVCALV